MSRFVTEPEWPALSGQYRRGSTTVVGEGARPREPVQIPDPVAVDDPARRIHERAAGGLHRDPDRLSDRHPVHRAVIGAAWIAHQRTTTGVRVQRLRRDEHDANQGSI